MWVVRRLLTVRRFAKQLRLKASLSASPVVAVSMVTSRSAWSRLKQGDGYEFDNQIVGGVVPQEYINSVDKGIKEQIANGVIAGYPVVDVKVDAL